MSRIKNILGINQQCFFQHECLLLRLFSPITSEDELRELGNTITDVEIQEI